MNILSQTYRRFQRWLARRNPKTMLRLQGQQGVVSFCFDDAPLSACTQGAAILNEFGVKGTYYIASGLTDRIEQGHLCHSVKDLEQLLAQGHHLGCHTHSHTPCTQVSPDQFKKDLQKNAQFLTQLGVPSNDRHFSFPLGEFDHPSKQIASQFFASTRTCDSGIHVQYADLSMLKANSLYSSTFDAAYFKSLIEQTHAQKAWLIIYTHDVDESPSQWGCTPALLRQIVQQSLQAGCRVLPINQAIQYWRASSSHKVGT
jgi:peptidoglycan/xylan/chitin deacetylase (PgdA/CDA1 family)